MIVGIGLAKQISIQGEYLGLIVPLGWLLIMYLATRARLKTDFDIDISIFKLDPVKKKKVMDVLIRGIIAIGFTFSCFMILFVAVPDTENQPYGPIPLILAAILFGAVALLLIVSIYFKLINKSNKK